MIWHNVVCISVLHVYRGNMIQYALVPLLCSIRSAVLQSSLWIEGAIRLHNTCSTYFCHGTGYCLHSIICFRCGYFRFGFFVAACCCFRFSSSFNRILFRGFFVCCFFSWGFYIFHGGFLCGFFSLYPLPSCSFSLFLHCSFPLCLSRLPLLSSCLPFCPSCLY